MIESEPTESIINSGNPDCYHDWKGEKKYVNTLIVFTCTKCPAEVHRRISHSEAGITCEHGRYVCNACDWGVG